MKLNTKIKTASTTKPNTRRTITAPVSRLSSRTAGRKGAPPKNGLTSFREMFLSLTPVDPLTQGWMIAPASSRPAISSVASAAAIDYVSFKIPGSDQVAYIALKKAKK